MNITTRAQGFETTNAIELFVREQVHASLQRFGEEIMAVDVFLKDANGPKGCIDKQALIRVRLRNRQVVALQTAHENLYAAIKKGSKRTRQAVRRHLRRSRRVKKQRMRDRLVDAGIAGAT